MLGERGGCSGLDGSTWRFAADAIETITSSAGGAPNDELWDLGRLFFDLAGLDGVRLYLIPDQCRHQGAESAATGAIIPGFETLDSDRQSAETGIIER